MIDQRDYLHQPSDRYASSHASSIVELPDGTMLASWFSGSWELNLDVAVVYRRKPPGQQHWEDLKLLHKTPSKADGNSVYYVEPDTGTVWDIFNTCYWKGWTFTKIRYRTSEDSGRTWSNPKWFHNKYGWLVANKGLTLANGDILIPVYSEVLGYRSFVMISTDRGKTFKKYGKVGSLSKGLLQPSIVQLGDGSLLMYCRTAGLNYIYQSRSFDNGRSWTRCEPTRFKNNNSRVSLVRLRNGDLVLVYNDSTDVRTPLNIALSEDEGKTWSYMKILEETPVGYRDPILSTYGGEYSYPYVIQARDGSIHMTYTEHRRQIVHRVVDLEWIKNPSS